MSEFELISMGFGDTRIIQLNAVINFAEFFNNDCRKPLPNIGCRVVLEINLISNLKILPFGSVPIIELLFHVVVMLLEINTFWFQAVQSRFHNTIIKQF